MVGTETGAPNAEYRRDAGASRKNRAGHGF